MYPRPGEPWRLRESDDVEAINSAYGVQLARMRQMNETLRGFTRPCSDIGGAYPPQAQAAPSPRMDELTARYGLGGYQERPDPWVRPINSPSDFFGTMNGQALANSAYALPGSQAAPFALAKIHQPSNPITPTSATPLTPSDPLNWAGRQFMRQNLSAPRAPVPVARLQTVSASPGELRPSNGIFSHMFGGPVPLKSSTGKTIGYYDHQVAGVALDITSKYAAIAPFFVPSGWLEALPATGGARVANALNQGIDEALQNHHALPKFLGGPSEQALIAIRMSLHAKLHQNLAAELRAAGFPPVGGTSGSTRKWLELFDNDPASYDQAVQILRRVSHDFDKVHNTTIGTRLERVLIDLQRKGGSRPSGR